MQLRKENQQFRDMIEDSKLEIKEIRDAYERLQYKNTLILQEMQESEVAQEQYRKDIQELETITDHKKGSLKNTFLKFMESSFDQ